MERMIILSGRFFSYLYGNPTTRFLCVLTMGLGSLLFKLSVTLTDYPRNTSNSYCGVMIIFYFTIISNIFLVRG